MGGGVPDGRTRPERSAAWHVGRRNGAYGQDGPHDNGMRKRKFGQTAKSFFYQIFSANRRKLRDGKATELRCVFMTILHFFHTMLAGLQLSKPTRNRGTQS